MSYYRRRRSYTPRRRWRRRFTRRRYMPRRYGYSRAFRNKVAAIASANSGPIVHTDNSLSTSVSSTGSTGILSDIAEGTSEHERRGEELRLLSVRFRTYTLQNTSADQTVFRFMLFRSMNDEQGSVPGVTDVLESAHPNALLNQDRKNQYIVLYDRKQTFSGAASGAGSVKSFNGYINLRNVKCSYDGNLASDYCKGHLYYLVVSNEATNTPTFSARIRVYMRSV